MRIRIKYILIAVLMISFLAPMQSCAKKKCITYSSSTTTGKLNKKVKKKNKSYKKKSKKKGGKMKTGKRLI